MIGHRGFLLLGFALAACRSSTGVTATGTRRSPPIDCGPPIPWLSPSGQLGLEGLEPAVRRQLDERVRSGHVAALRMEQRRCNVEIEVLACTRSVAYASVARTGATVDIYAAAMLMRGTSDVAGAGNLATAASQRRVSIDRRVDGERAVTWGGPGPAPPLAVEELRGADCARATHWASAVIDGTYRVLADDEPIDVTHCKPGSCREPVAIRYRPVFAFATPPRTPASMLPPSAPLAIGCPAPIPGQMTEQAAQAQRLFQTEKWADAAMALGRVVNGETGDDLGNRALAAFDERVALANLGLLRDGDAGMALIAEEPCHPRRAEAVFWRTIRDRRTTF